MSTMASSSSMSMSHLNSGFDNDLDSFLDLDQNTFTPSAASPANGKSTPSISHRSSFQSSSSTSSNGQLQHAFQGPSFQYGDYRQQTGLPMGGLANTFAVNRANGLQYTGNSGFVMPTETLNMPLSQLDEFDFGRTPSLDMPDMDFDAESPSDLPTIFYPSSSSATGQFVNPNALMGQDDSPSYTAPVQRMYPGMHSQQAAQAKAQQAQKQQEMLRQQQQRQLAGQRSLPSQGKTSLQKDPVVEESISRLLNQMRQNSVASTDDDASTPTGSNGNGTRIKKDEDDMDEDERLLASEEGKKLSSKERRQLRNKVSARAFRSRRKEYIGQLEGDLAEKDQEINDLKAQNRQLMEENTRLTDLTRMLLSSQSFSGFLNELSSSGLPAPASVSPQNQAQTRTQPARKDVNPHQVVRQLQTQTQIGMAFLPESATDFSMLDTSSNGWGSILPTNDFQVFALTELPRGPALSITQLSGKPDPALDVSPMLGAQKVYPSLHEEPATITSTDVELAAVVAVDDEVELDEEKYALYFDTDTIVVSPPTSVTLEAAGKVSDEKVTVYHLVLRSGSPGEDAVTRLNSMCSSLDASCERLASYISFS